nr:AraC family transcriptional regulator [Echinimonas agarilytica]
MVLAGRSELKTHYEIARERPEYHTLLITLSGGGLLESEHAQIPITSDTLVLLPAGKPHYFHLNTEPQWKTCWVLLDDSPRWQFMHEKQSQIASLSDEAARVDLNLWLLSREMESSAPNNTIIDLLAQTQMTYLDQMLDRKQQLPRQQLKLLQLFDDVNNQLHLDWSVADLAERMFISPPQLYRLCQQYMGTSPMQHISRLRVQRACDLLRHSDLSIRQIAQSLGYDDGLSFSHRFKKQMGVSPKLWRHQQSLL